MCMPKEQLESCKIKYDQIVANAVKSISHIGSVPMFRQVFSLQILMWQERP